MQSKLFVLLFFILIVSLTFSTNENKLRWKRKRSNINTQDIYSESKYQSILTSTENLQKNNTNFSNLLKNSIVPFNLLNKLSEKKNILGLTFSYLNMQDIYSESKYQSILTSTENLQIKNTDFSNLLEENPIVPSNLLNNLSEKKHILGQINNTNFSNLLENPIVPSNLLNNLSEKKNILGLIFAYLSLFELELNFKCTSRKFYNLYEKLLQQEKSLLKQHLQSKKNINCPRLYFDFFQKKYCTNPNRIEYSNVDFFSANLILFSKDIRQIIDLVFGKTEHRFIIFKNGDVSVLKKPVDKKYFVFTSLKEAPFESHITTQFCKYYIK